MRDPNRVSILRRTAVAVLALTLLTACDESATAPCVPGDGPLPGEPTFDLATALRGAGAEVEELGQRLDLSLFSVPTEVLRVNGAEVLHWRYCAGDALARDLGLYGIGVHARTPPEIPAPPDHHLFTLGRVVAAYDGSDARILELLDQVMGPELELPRGS